MKVTRFIRFETMTDAHLLTKPTYEFNTRNPILSRVRSYRAHGCDDIACCKDRDARLTARYFGSPNRLVVATSWLKRLYFLQDIYLR